MLAVIGFGVVGRVLSAVLAAKVPRATVRAYDPRSKSRHGGQVRSVVSLELALHGASHVFICVPSHLGGKGVDGPAWKKLAMQIGRHAELSAVVVVKSTLVPGDAEKLEKLTGRRVVVCPEFMAEGTAERDILKPHRVLVGGKDRAAVDSVIRLYRHWVPASRIIRMDAWSAQLTKLFANAMLAQRVSSINSMAALCELGGGDVRATSTAAGMDPRIGLRYLQPSVGFGGSCLEKDVRLLCSLAQCMGLSDVARYWQSVIAQNDAHILKVTRQISKMAGKGGQIAILGLAFKPGVADLRNSAPLRIAEALAKLGHDVRAQDSNVRKAEGFCLADNPYSATRGAAVVAVLNDEPIYRGLDWKRIAKNAAPGAKAYACSPEIGLQASTQMTTLVLGGAA